MSTQASIESIRPNIMGTTSVTMKAGNMRKAETFTVYPIHPGQDAKRLRLQSEHRTAIVDADTGRGTLSVYVANYPTFMHLGNGCKVFPFTLSELDLQALRLQVFTSANDKAGASGIMFTDNSGAARIL